MMTKHKWKPQWNCTVVEKFVYTDDGYFYSTKEEYAHHYKNAFEGHEGRIMLDRGKGHFFVDWSTRNMLKIEHEVIKSLRDALKDYLDSVRTKSVVKDMTSWTPIIAWTHAKPVKGLALCDSDGNVVRFARWDEAKKQYIPVDEHSMRLSILEREPFTEARWKQILADQKINDEYLAAQQEFNSERGAFHLKDHDPTWLRVMASLRTTLRTHVKTLRARLQETRGLTSDMDKQL